jgi:thymidylate synthase (FAD)
MWEGKQRSLLINVQDAYKWAIDHGIAKEQARSVLPEGMTVSRMYMNGTLRSWVHYIQLRSGIETQKEHREVAIACAEAIEPIFPMITEFVNV